MLEPVTGTVDFELHHGAKGRRVLVARDFIFADLKTAQVFERKIDASLGIVGGDVLPEICELQGGAGEIGKALAVGVAVSAKIKDEVTDGIRGIVAVGEDVVECFEASDGLVLTESDQQVGEFVLWNLELADGFGEGNEYGMFGLPS